MLRVTYFASLFILILWVILVACLILYSFNIRIIGELWVGKGLEWAASALIPAFTWRNKKKKSNLLVQYLSLVGFEPKTYERMSGAPPLHQRAWCVVSNWRHSNECALQFLYLFKFRNFMVITRPTLSVSLHWRTTKMKNLHSKVSPSVCVPVRVPCHLKAIKERGIIKKIGNLTQFKACLF
jgi:hypothetical protein